MIGIITRSTGSWYEIKGEDKKRYKGRLQGKFKIQDLKVTNPIAVGDRVEFQMENDEVATITAILPRNNYFIRKSVHKSAHGHLIASNLDQAVLIVTLVFPKTSLGFIDRFLVSTETFRIPSILVFNKTDLYDEHLFQIQAQLEEVYTKLNYQCLRTSVTTGEGIDELKNILFNKSSLFSGHSGVGKSSLLKAIAPQYDPKISEVSTFANKGVHTTTFAEMFELDDKSFIIDTPGIKELGVFEIGEDELGHYFPEMRDLLGQCKFHNCKHINEPKCAVIEKVKTGEIALSRYESYLSIIMNHDAHR
jgi:ribosome biogenesis GTPase / thiamine phosphate phosphatase